MRNYDSKRCAKLADIMKKAEHELADWKYYPAINGNSALAALFFFFLKYTNDRFNDSEKSEDLFKSMEKYLKSGQSIPENCVYDYLDGIVKGWNDSGGILMQYIPNIKIQKLPRDFLSVLYMMKCVNFCDKKICDDFIYAVSGLYASLYRETGLKDRLDFGEIGMLKTAGDLLECREGMTVYDFSCQTGVLLAYALVDCCTVYAQEMDFQKAVIAYLLLKMQNTKDVHMRTGDVLEESVTVQKEELTKEGILFDRIISLPPVRQKYEIGSCMNYLRKEEFLYDDSLQESGFWIYARHAVKKLKNGGKALLIAPVSVLSNEGWKRDRKRLLSDGFLKAVIQMPVSTSYYITKAVCCFIILEKEEKKSEDIAVYMADFSGEKAKKINYEQISQIVKSRKIIESVSKYVRADRILEQNMNITPSVHFRKFFNMKVKYETADILEKQKELFSEYRKSEEELELALSDYYQFRQQKNRR